MTLLLERPTQPAPASVRAEDDIAGAIAWPVLVAVLAIAASVTAAVIVHVVGQFGAYGDESAHLLHARRVFDSATPGVGQIGQYWPPLLHVLELPFVWIDPLYRSGWAGSLASMLAYLAGVAGSYRLGVELSRQRHIGALAALAFGANPVLLYLQSIPMMEATTAASLVWAAAGLARYWRTRALRDAVLAGFLSSIACWAHYGSWVLCIYGAVVVALAARRAGHSKHHVQTAVAAFTVAASYFAVLWLTWNFYLRGNPFDFATHTYSPVDSSAFSLGRPGNVAYALLSFGGAALGVLGPGATALVLIFIGVALARLRWFHPSGATLAASVFAVTALTAFGGTIGSPLLARLTGNDAVVATSNLRYGAWAIAAVPAAAIAIAGRRRWRLWATVSVLLGNACWFTPVFAGMPTQDKQSASTRTAERQAGAELRSTYTGGRVLLHSPNGGDEVIFRSGLHASDFITEFNGPLYRMARANPARYVRYIFVNSDDGAESPATLGGEGFQMIWSHEFTTTVAPFRHSYQLWVQR